MADPKPWYVTSAERLSNAGAYCRVRLAGPFEGPSGKRDACRYCEVIRRAAAAPETRLAFWQRAGGLFGHMSIGVERVKGRAPGLFNADFGLPTNANIEELKARHEAFARLSYSEAGSVRCWGGAEADLVEAARSMGLHTGPREKTLHSPPRGSRPLFDDAGRDRGYMAELADGTWRMQIAPDAWHVTIGPGPGDL